MSSNRTNTNDSDNPWEESGAMVYVALTVATFSALTMCCIWIASRHPNVRRWCRLGPRYTTLDEDKIQLQSRTVDSPRRFTSSRK